jgi:uncharacterized protein (DUF305 family)
MGARHFPTLAIVVLSASLLGACGDGSNSRGQRQPGVVQDQGTRSGGEGSASPLRGDDVDRAFVRGMIPHHQGAIDMARVELDKGKDPKTKALAQRVFDDQTREIAEMSDLAERKWGARPGTHRSGPMGALMGVPISMDTSKLGDDLAAAAEVDHMFLMMMVPHHAAAISMADEEQRHGADSKLMEMAGMIITAQAKEIGEIEGMLGS